MNVSNLVETSVVETVMSLIDSKFIVESKQLFEYENKEKMLQIFN